MALKKATKEFVEKYIPGIDVDKLKTGLDVQSAVRVACDRVERKKIAGRQNDAVSRGAGPGVVMVHDNTKEKRVVKKINSHGYIIFQGVAGAFNPMFWTVAEE